MLATVLATVQEHLTIAESGEIVQASKAAHLGIDHVEAHKQFTGLRRTESARSQWLADTADPEDVFDWVHFEPTDRDLNAYARASRVARAVSRGPYDFDDFELNPFFCFGDCQCVACAGGYYSDR
jgi:hypothetical protein